MDISYNVITKRDQERLNTILRSHIPPEIAEMPEGKARNDRLFAYFPQWMKLLPEEERLFVKKCMRQVDLANGVGIESEFIEMIRKSVKFNHAASLDPDIKLTAPQKKRLDL